MRRLMLIGGAAVWVLLCFAGGHPLLPAAVRAESVDAPGPASSAPWPAGSARESTGGPTAGGLNMEIADWQARWELARLLTYTHRYAEALAEYARLLKTKPDLWQAKAEMAQVLFWDHQPERALELFEQIPPSRLDDSARMVLADVYVARQQYAKAEPLLRAHLQKFPRDQRARLKLADLLSYEKNYKDSLEQYRIILQERPDDVQVRRRYARVLSWAGDRERAIAELQKTLK